MPRTPVLSQGKTRVAAGILRDPTGRVLITDRRRAKSMREYWEFPGGKIRSDESAQDALGREVAEELGVEVESCDFLVRLEHDYREFRVEIDFFLVRQWRGTPSGVEGQALQWLHLEELSVDTLLPADAPVIDILKQRKRG